MVRFATMVLPALCVACTFGGAAGGGADGGGSDTGAASDGAADSQSTMPADAGDGQPTDDGTGGDAADADTNADATTAPGDEDSGDTGLDPPPIVGCPDTLPDDWLFCSDFEGGALLEESFSIVENAGGRLGKSDANAMSGAQSLRVRYSGDGYGGYVGVVLGDVPSGLPEIRYGDGSAVREIWVHYKVATGETWPGSSVGRVARITSMSRAWDPDVQVSLRTENGSEALTAVAQDCSDAEGTNEMTEWDDFDDLDRVTASTPTYGETSSGQWHCVELHASLGNDAPESGRVELWVDGVSQGVADNLEWPGGVRGFNYVAISNAWADGEGAPPVVDGEIFFDDLIISTAPIDGC